MSLDTAIDGLYAMLADMTVANGYNYDYVPVESPLTPSGKTVKGTFIGLRVGFEENLEEGASLTYYRASIPVTFIARVPLGTKGLTKVELLEAKARAKVKDDIKHRFGYAHREVAPCITFEPLAEEEAEWDSNVGTTYLYYTWNLTYKTNRQL